MKKVQKRNRKKTLSGKAKRRALVCKLRKEGRERVKQRKHLEGLPREECPPKSSFLEKCHVRKKKKERRKLQENFQKKTAPTSSIPSQNRTNCGAR